jgi:hypothetical protein
MKLRLAAAFSGITALVALAYSLLVLRPALRLIGVHFPRQAWLNDNPLLWQLGAWLWLLAIFGWMLVLVVVSWSYLPGHRIPTMLQGGLLTIAAVLAIAGVAIWMSALPWAMRQPDAAQWSALVDVVALGLLGAGLLMAGLVSAWQAVDLARLNHLPVAWTTPMFLAGIAITPSPFLLPAGWQIAAGALLWVGWCFFLATRSAIPSAYSEWR